jgi:hypothetical protein
MSTNLMDAHKQWASRPDDEKYLTPEALEAACRAHADASFETDVKPSALTVNHIVAGNGVDVGGLSVSHPDGVPMTMNNWSFGQLARRAGLPGRRSDWAKWHPRLVAANLNFGLKMFGGDDASRIYVQKNGTQQLRSLTSTSYGRIYDWQVVEMMRKINEAEGGVWKVPPANAPWNTGRTYDPRELTTLYASAEDVFMFLVDESRPIEIGKTADGHPDLLCRGVILWNSEVGKCIFGVKTFLYRYICANRIIWGAEDVFEVNIRHTLGAPDRFLAAAIPALEKYSQASLAGVENSLRRAKALPAGKSDEEVLDFLGSGGYSKIQATLIMQRAESDEGDNRSVWSLVQGATAMARDIEHADRRVEAEEKASALLSRAA